MRSYLPDFDLQVPESLGEALAQLTKEPGQYRPFAGGTDLMVLLNAGLLPGSRFLDLSRCEELRGIQETSRRRSLS